MVLSYNNVRQKRRQQRTKAPPLQAILIAMAVRRCNIAFITRCSMTRASPEAEATERRHRATTHSVSPGRPPGQQSTQQLGKMYPLCWSFWWPSQCGGSIPRASPNGGGSWLNAAIGWALTPISSIGHAYPYFRGILFYCQIVEKELKLP